MIGNAQDVSGAEARRIALRAQGLGRLRPGGEPMARQVRAVVWSLGAVQLDAIDVSGRGNLAPHLRRATP